MGEPQRYMQTKRWTDGQVDGETDMMQLKGVFQDYSNTPT